MEIRVGCCGWCIKGGKNAYYFRFPIIEVQETFYKLPKPETVSRWAESAPENFKFCMKAWQVITHPPISPTWKKSGLKIPISKHDRYGSLKPTEENLKAWEETLKVCKAMKTEVCVFQTPASFGYSEENMRNIEAFFSTIRRDGVILGWEPRGTWRENLQVVGKLCDVLELVHIVDPFRCQSQSSHQLVYFRLHGIGGKEYNYRYKYADSDLMKLGEIVKKCVREKRTVYVLFNNVYMADDATRFMSLLKNLGLPVIST